MNEQQEALNQLEALQKVQSYKKMEERLDHLETTISKMDRAISLLNKSLGSLQFQLTNQGAQLRAQNSLQKETVGKKPPSVTD